MQKNNLISRISAIRFWHSIFIVVKIKAASSRVLIRNKRDAKSLFVIIFSSSQVAAESIKAAVIRKTLRTIMAEMPFSDWKIKNCLLVLPQKKWKLIKSPLFKNRYVCDIQRRASHLRLWLRQVEDKTAAALWSRMFAVRDESGIFYELSFLIF